MATAKSFEELDVWKNGKKFTVLIYKVTNSKTFSSDFSLRDQLRRASVSIISNIAEGFERNGNKEFIRFLKIAKGSAGEIRAQLYIAFELDYISNSEFKELYEEINLISKQLSSLITYLRNSEQQVKKPSNLKPSTL
jgi:four helix bundle protein